MQPRLGMTRVQDVMTTWPVVVGADDTAEEARCLAEAWGVHHLMVTSEQALVGVVCQCDLAHASDDEPVSQRMQSPFVFVTPGASIDAAAETMIGCGVGCLPVLDELGRLTGVVTRRDLREAGALPGAPGFDTCAACGATHGLKVPARGGAVVFCAECIGRAQPHDEHATTTLGGSD